MTYNVFGGMSNLAQSINMIYFKTLIDLRIGAFCRIRMMMMMVVMMMMSLCMRR